MTFSLKQFLRKSMLSAMTVSLVAPTVAPLAFANEIVAPSPKTLTLSYGYGGNLNFIDTLITQQDLTPGSDVILKANTLFTNDDGEEYNSNYVLYQVHVVTDSGAVINGEISEDRSTVTFKMPDENATVYASFANKELDSQSRSIVYNKNVAYEVNKDVSITLDRPMGYEIGEDITFAVHKPKNYKFDTLSINGSDGETYKQELEITDDENALIRVKSIKGPVSVTWSGHTVGESESHTNVDTTDVKSIDKDLSPYDPHMFFTKDILDQSKIKSIDSNSKPRAIFTVKKTYFDRSKVKNDDTLDSIYDRDLELSKQYTNDMSSSDLPFYGESHASEFAMLAQDESNIALYDVDPNSEYLVGHIPGLVSEDTFEMTFAENNVKGIVLDDISYDSKNHIIYVPRKYYTQEYVSNHDVIAISPVQVQFAQKANSIQGEKDVTVTVDKVFNSEKIASSRISTLHGTHKATISLGDQEFLSKLSSSDFTIYDNGVPIRRSHIAYNANTHTLEINSGVSSSGQLDVYISKDKNFLFGFVETRGEKRSKESYSDSSANDISDEALDIASRPKTARRDRLSNRNNWEYTTESFTIRASSKPHDNQWFKFRTRMGNVGTGLTLSEPSITYVTNSVSDNDAAAFADWVVNNSSYNTDEVAYWIQNSNAELNPYASDANRFIEITSGLSGSGNGTTFTFSGSRTYILLSCAHVQHPDASGEHQDWGLPGFSTQHYNTIDARIYAFHDQGNGRGWAVIGLYTPKFGNQSGIGLLTVKMTYPTSTSTDTTPTPTPRPRPNPTPPPGNGYTPPPSIPQPRPRPNPSPSTKEVFFKIRKVFKNAQSVSGSKYAFFDISLDGSYRETLHEYASLSADSTTDTYEGPIRSITLPASYYSGTITVKETNASSNYSLASAQYNRIYPPAYDGDTGSITNPYIFTVTNTPSGPTKGRLVISKQWEHANGTRMSDSEASQYTATIAISSTGQGEQFQQTISLNGNSSKELEVPFNTYSIEEQVDSSFESASSRYTATVSANQTYATVTFLNRKINLNGNIRISKRWVNTHSVSGDKVATFTITGPNNFNRIVTLTGDNSTEINDIPTGEYSISESTANTNYTVESRKTVYVYTRDTANVEFVNNSKPQNGKIRISKRWVNKDRVAGDKVATFTVTGPNNYRKTVSITGDASTEINDVPKGQYSISEATSNTNYTVEAAKSVTVTPEQTASIEFVNNPKEVGSLKLRKLSSNPSLTNTGQYAKYYSLDGAVFTLTYLDNPSRTWTLTTGSVTVPPGRGQREQTLHGIATLNNLPLGRYKLVETKAPKGFTLNSTPKEFTLNNSILQTIDFTNSPQRVDDLEPRIRTTATDSFTNSHQGSFGNKLSITDRVEYSGLTPNTEYEVVGTLMRKSNSQPLQVNGQPLTVTKRFTTTDKVGTVNVTFETPMTDEVRQQLENDSVVVYEDLYEDLATNRHILVGHRNIDDEAQTVKYGKVVTTAKAKSSGGHVSSSPETTISDLVEYKNLIPGQKYKVVATVMSKETGQRLSNSPSLQVSKVFTPTSPNGSVTVDISNIPIEPGKSAVIFETIYFGDTTIVVGRHEDINDEDQTLHTPKVETTAKDKLTDSHSAPSSGNRVLTDTVELTNLVPGQTYTLEGKFVDKTNPSVAIATATKQFTANAANMSETLEFTVDTSQYAGKDLVAFEYLKVNSTWTATPTPTVVAKHDDLSSKSQTVTVGRPPQIHTSATDRATGDHVGTLYGQRMIIDDVVSYENLEVGKRYILHGKLMRKSNNTMLANTRVVTKEFTPTSPNGTVTVTFSMAFAEAFKNDLAGDSLVVFEKLTTADDTNKVIASHEDIHSSDQTVTYSKVTTNASSSATGEQITSNGVDSIVDVVTYKNLIPNKEYKVVATLMDKVRNAPILRNNQPITVEKTFTPTTANGEISVTFENVTLTPGSTAVAFEKIYLGTTLVGKHEDIDSPEQSVNRSSIRTTAKEKTTNAKYIDSSSRKTLVDIVSYTNLVPGKEYVIEGSFVRKNDTRRTQIATARKVFTPTTKDGEVTLEFNVDASKYPNEDLVAFETLKVKKVNSTDYVEVASHKDPNDSSQTVHVNKKNTDLPATGTLGIIVTMLVATGLIGSVAYLQYKKRK